MKGTEQLAMAIANKYSNSLHIQECVNSSCEPLRAMVYETLGSGMAASIDGTDLYHEIVDHLEEIY